MPPKFSREIDYPTIYQGETPGFQPRTSPCEMVCPAGIAIQSYLALVAQDKLPEAIAVMQAANPFPGITGHYCEAPCERVCNRKKLDRSVSLRELERILAARIPTAPLPERQPGSGKKVAVVGAGLAGLTAAWFLSWFGHGVTVFEAGPKPGGSIMDLASKAKDMIEPAEGAINRVLSMGVDFRPGRALGRDLALEALVGAYDAILLSTGRVDSLVDLELDRNEAGYLRVDSETRATSRPGVYAAGEVVTGPVSVAATISGGRLAAVAMDAFLRNSHFRNVRRVFVDSEGKIRIEEFESQQRLEKPYVVGFEELRNMEYFDSNRNLAPAAAGKDGAVEAQRCLHCGHCIGCGTCADVCPGDILAMENGRPRLAYPEECIHCGACFVDCPTGAISFHIPLPMTIAPCPDGLIGTGKIDHSLLSGEKNPDNI